MSCKSRLKLLALATACLFTFQNIVAAAPSIPSVSHSSSTNFSDLYPYVDSLPSEMGILKESHLPSEKNTSHPFVIHIQDAHANPEAQSRICDVLFWIKDHAPSKNIVLAVEGSAGPIHPEYFNFFEQYPEANQAVVNDLHRKGEISGVELFSWEQYKQKREARSEKQEEVKIVGVEDVELYRDNLANYRELIFKQDEINTALKPLRSHLEITKSKILNPRLRDFLRQKDEAKSRLHAYIVNDLATQTQKILNIDLKDRIEQIRFPNLTRVIFLDEIEKKVNLAEAQKQWGDLRQEFEKAGVDKALLGLLDDYLRNPSTLKNQKQSLRQIFESIFSNQKAQTINFEKYSSYIHWTAYTLLSQEIQSEELFEEVSRLQDAIAEKLAETEKEKEYLSLDKNYSLFEHLLHLELTRSEYEKLSTNSAVYRAEALSKQIWNLNPTRHKNQINFESLNQFSDQSLRFYQNARKRDEVLLSNALKADPKASVVVLVTGGFHSEGLTDLMKDHMIPYAVIAPRMTSVDDHQLYHKVLRREHADVSEYMKDLSLTKQEALFLKGVFEQAVPVLAQKYQLVSKDLSQQAKEAVNRHPVLMNRFQAETFVNRDQQSVLRLSPNPVSVLSSISNKAVAEILLSSDRYAVLANQPKNIQDPVVSDLTFTSKGGVSVRDVSVQRVDLGAGKNRVTVTSGPLESLGIARSETRSEIKEIAERIFRSLKGELGTYEFVQDEVMLLGDTDAVRMLVYSWAAAAKLPADPEIIVDAVVELIRKDSAEDPKSNTRSEVRNQAFFNPEAMEEEKNGIFDQRIQEVLEHIRTTDPQSYAGLEGADLVIAIPFYREKTTPRPLVDSLRQALQDPLFAARKTSIVFITEADTESSDELHQMVEKIQGDFTDPQYGVKSGKISILYFSKPYEILPSDVPHEPYRGKPWTVRAAIQVASLANKGQSADLVILDADLIFTNKKESAKKLLLALLAPLEIESQSQMSPLWQTEDLQHPADIVTLDARRVFRYDDGIVHLFTYLMYDSFFGLQVPEAHGGDFSLSKRYIRQLIGSEEWRSLIQTDAYELESQLALRAQGMGMKVAAVEMSGKTHTLVESAKIFSRLTQVINPLFLDVLRYGRLTQNLSLQTWARTERPALGIEDVFDGLYRRDLGEGIKSVLKHLEDVDSSLGRGRQIFPEILGELWGYKLGYGGPGKVFDRGIGAADWGYATAKYLDRLKNELESGHEVLGPLALSYKLMIYLGALSFGNHILMEFKQWDQATKYLKEDFSPKFKEEAQKGFQRSELRSDVRAVFDRFLESVHPDEFIKSSHPNNSKPWVFRQFQPKAGGMIDVMIAVEADHLRFNVYHRGEREGSLKVRQKFNFGNKDTQVAIQQQGAWYDQIYRGNNPIQDIRFDNELQILTVTVTPGFYEFWNRFNRDFPKKLGPLLDTWPIKFEEQVSEQRPASRSEVRLPATHLPDGQGQARSLQVELSDHTILLKENDDLVSKLQIRATLLDEGEGGYVNASTVFKTINQLQGAKKIVGWQAAKDRDGFTLDLEDGSAIYVMEKGATFFPARSEVRAKQTSVSDLIGRLSGKFSDESAVALTVRAEENPNEVIPQLQSAQKSNSDPKIQQNLKWILNAIEKRTLVKETAATHRSELRQIPVSTTNLSTAEELEALQAFLGELKKEQAKQNAGNLVRVSVFSDQHGTIDKFDALIVDSIRAADPRLPVDFKLIPPSLEGSAETSLEAQLRPHGISLTDLRGKLYFHNLGDLMDRGPYGVRVYQRSKELIQAGLSDFVIGNHDLWEFMNLQAFHLPWYEGYNFYGYTDRYDKSYGKIQDLVKRYHQESPETREKTGWVEKLAEFNDFHNQQQKTKWAGLEQVFNQSTEEIVTGQLETVKKKNAPKVYSLFGGLMTEKQQQMIGQFLGYNPKTDILIYTGIRAVGTVSIKWWEDLLGQFKAELKDLNKNTNTYKLWRVSIDFMEEEIIPGLRGQLEKQLAEGKWWWRAFEAINYQNYTSVEWWAKDWSSHKDWGTAVIDELNEGIDKNDARYVTQANYLKNPILLEIGDFFRDNFTLYLRDIYQNVYMHAFLPIDDEGRFHFTYKGVHYVGNGQGQEPSVWEGLDRITADVRNRKNSMSDIYEALSLVNEWYADNTTVAKVPDVVKAIAAFSAENLARQNGFNRFFTGHLPFNEFNKQKAKFPETIKGFVVDEKFIFTDHGMGKRFGGRGARIDIRDQLQLRGYEHGDATLLVSNPRTVELKDGREEVLFANPSIERKAFLGQVIKNVEERMEAINGILVLNGDGNGVEQSLQSLQNALKANDLSNVRLLAQRLIESHRKELIKFYVENRNRRDVLRDEAQKSLIKDVIASARSEVRVADHEAERARAYWKGELVTTPIDRPFRASRKDDVFDIVDDLSEEDAVKLEALAVTSLLKGEGYISMLVAGASNRMNTKEAPDEVKELVKNKKLKSKAAVPIGVSKEGKVTTYLGEFGENVARLFKLIDEEARKNRIESKVWENAIGLLSSEQYRDEHDSLLIENAFYGLSQHHVRFFHQPLGAKFVGTEKDVENLKDKFSSEKAYREALAYSRLSSEHFEKGNHHQLVLADERDPQGHGEYFHQLIVSGELLHMIDTGKKWGFAKNVDNYAAKFDKIWLRTLGLFLERGLDFQPEVSPRAPGQKGGSLIVMEDNKAHQLAEDPNIVATNKINEAKGLPIVKPTDSYWFNDAVAFFSIPYVMNIYKKEGQTDAEFVQELRKASLEERELIANRGRKKFPSLVDPKPAKERNAAAVKVETNMWQSTGVVGPEMKIAAVGVRGARNFPITQYAQMTPKQKEAELAKLRFLSTKQWTKTEKEVQDAREQMEKDLGRKVSDQELWITLETYEGNKIIAEDLLHYNRQAELITPGTFDFLKILNQILNALKWWREQLFVSESTGIDLDLVLDLDAAIEDLESPATVNPQTIAAAVNLEEKLKNQFPSRSELRAPKLTDTDTADKLQLGDSSLIESAKQQDNAEKTAVGFKPVVVSQVPDSETQSGSSAGQILKMLIPLIRGEKGELTRQELESILSQSAIFMIMDNEQSPSVVQLGWIELKGNAKRFRYSNPPFTPESKNWQVISRVVNELRNQFGKKAGFISYEKFSDREKRKKIEPRLLDLKNNSDFERFNVASKILSLYLKDKGLPQRSELRGVNPTTVFTNDFLEWKNTDLSSLEQVHPDLAAIRLTAEQTAASFYDIPALFTKLPETEVFDFLAKVLVPDVLAGTTAPEVLDAVRDALGPYAWLLDSGSSPVHVTKVVEEKSIKVQDYLGLIALAAANQDQVTLVWKGGSEVQAQAIEAELEAQAEKLGVPDFANRFNVLGSDGANSVDSVRVIRQIAGSPAKLQIGTLDESLDFLQELGYVRGLSRVHNADRLNDQTAILITAALLREQISNPYDIVNLQKWMQEKGIDANSLVEHVGRMIQVLQHIATQA